MEPPDTGGSSHLQIIRVLDGLFIGVFHKARIAAEGIREDGFLFLFFHGKHLRDYFASTRRNDDCLLVEGMVKSKQKIQEIATPVYALVRNDISTGDFCYV